MKLLRLVHPFLFSLALIGPFSAPLKAYIFPYADSDLVNEAAYVLHGTVEKMHSEWSQGQKVIHTNVTITPKEFLKSKGPTLSGPIVVRLLGGTVGETTMKVVEMPSFEIGEEVLVFLNKTPHGLVVSGLHHGKFSLRKAGALQMNNGGKNILERFKKVIKEQQP